MSTITGIRTIGITTADQDRAIAFFRETLGFEVRIDADGGSVRWVEVAPTGGAVTVALVAGERPGSSALDTGIRFTVPDAAAEHSALASRGAAVGELLRWPGVPAMFTFDDLDGNRFEIIEQAGEES